MKNIPPVKSNQVVVSGYYGFGNLGDEAILEEITNELKRLIPANQITVLSAAPAQTKTAYGVNATNRSSICELFKALRTADVFISGGGGLFQDKTSLFSPVYYGAQMLLAKLFRARVMVYAQGLGPLKNPFSKAFTRQSFKIADFLSVRDEVSLSLLNSWGINAVRTADPVWSLPPSQAPDELHKSLLAITSECQQQFIGISLRADPNLSQELITNFADVLDKAFPAPIPFLLLALQDLQDQTVLETLQTELASLGRKTHILETRMLSSPSQWLDILKHCQFVVSMRLHALIMSLKLGIPVVGLAYDPKVKNLLTEFEQPILNLTKDEAQNHWESVLKTSFANKAELSRLATAHLLTAERLACQNFSLLAKILDMQSDS